MPSNPRAAINHPSGSFFEINEYNSKNEDGDDSTGGNVQLKSVGNMHITSSEELNLISNGSNVFLAKDSIHEQAAKLTMWGTESITLENQVIPPGSDGQMGNRISMLGCITTLESMDKAKIHIQGGPGMATGIDSGQITLTYDSMSISMNNSLHIPKIEIKFNDFTKIIMDNTGIDLIGIVKINGIPQVGD